MKEKEKEKVDLEKLKKLKREEIAKNKMTLERKKKLAEKKLAKAEAKALKEAEEKLKVISSSLSAFFLFV
jgi:hypothetical protein